MPDLGVGDKCSFGLVIFSSEGDNMVSHWEDYIFINRRKDGRFSIKAYKWGENFRSPNRYVWIPIDSVIGVSSATDLIAAVGRMESTLAASVDWSDVIGVIRVVDAKMADSLDQAIN
jgi:hypothetical protein